MFKKLIVFVTVIYCAFGADLPADYKKCKRSDSNFNECLKDAIQDVLPKMQNGVPQFNIPKIQPVELPSLTIGAGKGPVNVEQKYKDAKIYNIPQAKLDKVEAKFDNDRFTLNIDAVIPEVIMDGEYTFNGQVLLLPIVGNGQAHSIFSNMKTGVRMQGTKKGEHINIEKVTVSLDPSLMVLHYSNLFNGDERLANEMLKVLNENWKEIWDDVKESYGEVIAVVVKDITNKFFKNVSDKDIFPL